MSWSDIPNWIIAIIALTGAIMTWQNGRRAQKNHDIASETRDTLNTVQAQTNGMAARLEQQARTEGHDAGVSETLQQENRQ